MTFVEDADFVRAYVRGAGQVDYVHMRQVDSTCVEVVFSANVDLHAAALGAQVQDGEHIIVRAGSLPAHRRDELGVQYWDDDRRNKVLTAWPHGSVLELHFGYDDDGPFLKLGLRPHTQAVIDQAVAAFAPYRVKTFDGPHLAPA